MVFTNQKEGRPLHANPPASKTAGSMMVDVPLSTGMTSPSGVRVRLAASILNFKGNIDSGRPDSIPIVTVSGSF